MKERGELFFCRPTVGYVNVKKKNHTIYLLSKGIFSENYLIDHTS